MGQRGRARLRSTCSDVKEEHPVNYLVAQSIVYVPRVIGALLVATLGVVLASGREIVPSMVCRYRFFCCRLVSSLKGFSMKRVSSCWLCTVLLASMQPKSVSLGADLTPAQRQALLDHFGAKEGTDTIVTISTVEMTAAMQNIMLVPPGYKSVSSTALTCRTPGSGLRVTTEHITKVTAGMYAGALLTAGIGDADLIVAAPADAEAEGMTALTGMFKGLAGGVCGRGALDPKRRELAYRWLATTARVGDALGDQTAAAKLVLSAQHELVTGGKRDPAAVEPALNNAVKNTRIGVPAAQRRPILDLLRQIAEAKIDWGSSVSGWQLQELNPHEVRLTTTDVQPSAVAGTGAAVGNTAEAGTSGFVAGTSTQNASGQLALSTMVTQLIAQFIVYVPRVIGALLIAVVGLVLALVAQRSAGVLLERLRFDQISTRSGVTALLDQGNIQHSPSQLVGRIVFYVVLVLALLAALGALGLEFLSTTLNQVFLYAPRALAAGLLLFLGTAAAGLMADLTDRTLSGAGVTRAGGLPTFVRFSVIFITALVVAAVLQIEVTILVIIAVLVLGGVVLAAALAIGLGLRDLSQNIAASRYVAEGLSEGDHIRIAGASGTIERIGHAVTTVRGDDGAVYLIPNAYFMGQIVQKVETERQ